MPDFVINIKTPADLSGMQALAGIAAQVSSQVAALGTSGETATGALGGTAQAAEKLGQAAAKAGAASLAPLAASAQEAEKAPLRRRPRGGPFLRGTQAGREHRPRASARGRNCRDPGGVPRGPRGGREIQRGDGDALHPGGRGVPLGGPREVPQLRGGARGGDRRARRAAQEGQRTRRGFPQPGGNLRHQRADPGRRRDQGREGPDRRDHAPQPGGGEQGDQRPAGAARHHRHPQRHRQPHAARQGAGDAGHLQRIHQAGGADGYAHRPAARKARRLRRGGDALRRTRSRRPNSGSPTRRSSSTARSASRCSTS